MHVVVMGCGRVGARLSTELSAQGHEVTVIDKNADAFSRLGREFSGTTVTGIGFDRDILTTAVTHSADAFAALSSGDNSNIIAARVAREVFQVPKVIARIYDEQRASVFEKLGVPTVATVPWTARRFFDLITEDSRLPQAWTAPTGDVVLIPLKPSESWVGHTVVEFEVQAHCRVAVLQRLGKSSIPSGDEILHGDEQIFASVTTDMVEHARKMAGVPVEGFQ